MPNSELSTEEKIKDAAKKIFLEKGFGSATTRDIAECADTNIALVNYYFRSKEKLFQEVFRDSFTETFMPVTRILNDDLPLEAKIYKFVDHMTELLKRDPLLPMFVLSEMRGENSKICESLTELQQQGSSLFQAQLQEEAEKGNIRSANFEQVELSLMAMVIFPFLSMNMIKMKKNLSTEEFHQLVDERKKNIPEMLLTYLRQKG
ncbi:MAG: TetR/AcrR family transcriptional regulator [Saprospiraceae bacterium]|nr:TetR/AcrR family transcriptional regulator [Saprospiraceae bacterium]